MLKTLAGQSSSREVVQDSGSPDLLFHASTVAPQVRRSNVVAQDVTLFCRLFTTAADQIVFYFRSVRDSLSNSHADTHQSLRWTSQ